MLPNTSERRRRRRRAGDDPERGKKKCGKSEAFTLDGENERSEVTNGLRRLSQDTRRERA